MREWGRSIAWAVVFTVLRACTGGSVSAQTTTTTLPKYTPSVVYPLGGPLIRLAGNATCAPCEMTGSVAVSGSERISADCDGLCDVRLVCRFPSQSGQRDFVLASLQPADGEARVDLVESCETAVFQILSCAPTTQSATCRVRAWLW